MTRFLTLLAAMIALVCAGAGSAWSKDIKVGYVYIGHIGDAGWTYAHELGRQAIDKLPGVSTSYVEAVLEGSDSERVIKNMARKGYDLIFTTSFGYMDPTLKVAKRFPKAVFMHCSGYKSSKNVGNYFGRMYQARYLSGMVAGGMTKANKIGYVAAFPIPEVIRGINAFTLGVQAVNPDAQVNVVWTKTWYDPATEKEGGKSLLETGCDVVTQHQDTPGVQEAAQEAGKYSIGYNSDMARFAPKAHLTAPVWNWGPFYKDMVAQVQAGTWKTGSYWPGLESGIIDLAPFGPMVPQKLQAQVLAAKKDIADGAFKVFTGPIKDQAGKVIIPAGKVATDGQLLGMDWFVQGVQGSTK